MLTLRAANMPLVNPRCRQSSITLKRFTFLCANHSAYDKKCSQKILLYRYHIIRHWFPNAYSRSSPNFSRKLTHSVFPLFDLCNIGGHLSNSWALVYNVAASDRRLYDCKFSGQLYIKSTERIFTKILLQMLSLIHIWRCRRSTLCRSRWSPYH